MRNEITSWIDGKRLAVLIDDDAGFASGAIALLCQYNSTVQFQEILIQELANDHKIDEPPRNPRVTPQRNRGFSEILSLR